MKNTIRFILLSLLLIALLTAGFLWRQYMRGNFWIWTKTDPPHQLPASAGSPFTAPHHLLKGDWLPRWEKCAMLAPGPVKIEPGLLTLEKGGPMTGLRLRDAEKLLLATNYRLNWQARRVAGRDFFCGLTFPVNEKRECLSLIVGGWGGKLLGISSLDDQDASQNETGSEQDFINETWYRFIMEVRPDRLRLWIDDKVAINVSLRDRRIGLKASEIEMCAPFGIATYATTGEIKDLVLEPLPGP